MTRLFRLHPAHIFLWLIPFFLFGCSAPKSYVVLLPKGGEGPGEVIVTTSKGSQVLSHPWEMSGIRGNDAPPGKPAPVTDLAAQSEMLTVLSSLPPQPVHFILYFHAGSTELMPESQLLIPEIVKWVQQRPAAEISIVGHTDTVASESYNFDLGKRRAERVLALLRGLGARPVRVETFTRGECDLFLQTPDQTAAPCNRRAEVTVR